MLKRREQKTEDTWDLTRIYKSEDEWREELQKAKSSLPRLATLKGTLGLSKDSLYNALIEMRDQSRRLEKLYTYAMLSYAADASERGVQMMMAEASALLASFSESASFFDSELVVLSDEFIEEALSEERFEEFRVYIKKARHMREHVLTEKEERLLSLYSPLSNAFQETFQDLENVDMSFDDVDGKELTNATYSLFLQSPDESVREKAYRNYYSAFERHKNTIARIYLGSIKGDVFTSRARGFSSSLEASLFPDKVPLSVYTSLIKSVHEAFPTLHRYYGLRAKIMEKEKLSHWDVYVPLSPSVKKRTTYNEAVSTIVKALSPLGEDYVKRIHEGLLERRWVDRYENVGKRSGAFSSGSYDTEPYILMSFNEEDITSIFTLAHEGGHSMHSLYSRLNNPYMSYNYTIFEAEVASTTNEQLLHHFLYENAKTDEEKAFLLSKHIDDIVATLFRQTMFAEFELLIHREYEEGHPVTIDVMRSLYLNLLKEYFGERMEFIDLASLEGLRIPHFYNAFYVYKYATGISAAIALSDRLLTGGEEEREDYLSFLRSGGSLYPIESLKRAGVDMSTTAPVKKATEVFKGYLDKFEDLMLKKRG